MPEDCPCEKLWIENPTVLLKTNLLVEDLCESNNINAFTRSVIIGLVFSGLLSPFMGLGGLGIILLIIIFLYHRWLFAKAVPAERSIVKNAKKTKEGFVTCDSSIVGSPGATVITRPTAANPFMNVLLDELTYNPNRPRADGITTPSNNVVLDDYFRVQWNSDPTDVFGRSQGQRQFYTTPSTSIPNDQTSYMNWLYLIPGKTCKEGGRDACIPGTQGAVVPWLSSPN
jgi:hypothetical protein